MIRNGGNTDWNETNGNSDAVIKCADPRTVTLDVYHFTGFKLSISGHSTAGGGFHNSRIPRAVEKVKIKRSLHV